MIYFDEKMKIFCVYVYVLCVHMCMYVAYVSTYMFVYI